MTKSRDRLLAPRLWRFGPTFDMVVSFSRGTQARHFVKRVLGSDQVTRLDPATSVALAGSEGVECAVLHKDVLEFGFKLFVIGDASDSPRAYLSVPPGQLSLISSDFEAWMPGRQGVSAELVEVHRVLLCLYAEADKENSAVQVALQEETSSHEGAFAEGVVLHSAAAQALALEGVTNGDTHKSEWPTFWRWSRQACG